MSETNLVFHDPRKAPFLLTGFPWLAENGNYNRIPERLMPILTEKQLTWVAPQPSGGTIRFRTDSRKIAVRVELLRDETCRFNTQASLSGFDAYMEEGDGLRYLFNLGLENNPISYTAETPWPLEPKMRDFVLYTPLQNPLKSVEVGLEEGAQLLAPSPFSVAKPILFYGSSITCGFSATRSGLTYPAQIARALNADFINLGFGGGARGEREIAEAIASLDLSCFVMDYDYNAPDINHLRRTHKPFFDVVRAAHPELPIIIISSPYNQKSDFGFAERRAVIEATFRAAVDAGEQKVWFLDGSWFFGREPDWPDYTVDTIHPNDRGFRRMVEGILPTVKQALGLQ